MVIFHCHVPGGVAEEKRLPNKIPCSKGFLDPTDLKIDKHLELEFEFFAVKTGATFIGGETLHNSILFGQIIATENTTDLPPNGGLVREVPLFQGNLGW